MANVFKPKRSSTASSVPTTSNLADGELAVNSSDKKIYLRDGNNIIEVANASSGGSSGIATALTHNGSIKVETTNTGIDVTGIVTATSVSVGSTTNIIRKVTDVNSWVAVDSDTSFSVTSQQNAPTGLYFKSNGTKMFVVGTQSPRDVEEYALSTAWDITTASHTTGYSINSQDTSPQGLYFSPNGENMFVAGNSSDSILHYTLSTGWDLTSTVNYVGNFSVSSQATLPTGVTFGDSGTKMYVTGRNNDSIHQYNLSSAYTITSGVSHAHTLDIGQTSSIIGTPNGFGNPHGISISSDGTKIWIIGAGEDIIAQFNLGTAYDLSTATYNGDFTNIYWATSTGYDLYIDESAEKGFVLFSGSIDSVREIDIANSGLSIEANPTVRSANINLNNNVQVKGRTWFEDAIVVNGSQSSYFQHNVQVQGQLTCRSTIDLADGSADRIQFGASDDAKIYYDGTDNYFDLQFSSADNNGFRILNSSDSELFRVAKDGKVGIGTDNPTHELDIESVSPTIELRDSDNDYTFQLTQSGSATYVDFDHGGGGSSSLRIRNATDEKIRIQSDGSIGIGTNNPLAKLDVRGHIKVDEGPTLESGGSGNLQVSTDYGYLRLGPQNSSYSHFYTDLDRFYFNKKLVVDTGTISSYNEDLILQTSEYNGPTERVRILTSNGYVGINTASPTATLDVDGGAHVSGNVGIGTTNPLAKLDVRGTIKTQQLNVSGVSTFTGDVSFGSTATFGDDDKLKFGDGGDLQIYHNGNHSRIEDAGIGKIQLGSDTQVEILNGSFAQPIAQFNPNGSVDLYYANSKKFETIGAGVTVTGDLLVSNNARVSGILTVGSSSITLNGTDNSIHGYDALIAPPKRDSIVTITVTVATKTSAHRYYDTGSTSGYFLNGVESPFLTLIPGRTYKFDQSDSSNAGHPLRLYRDVDKNTQYSTNVTTVGTPGSSGAYTQIITGDTTPTVLHYQCSAHVKMGNSLQTNSEGSSTDASSGTYGDARYSPQITVDASGRITGITEVEIFSSGLGADLDLNSNDITGTGNINITGAITASGNINANGDIVGDNSTNISGISSVTATSFHGSASDMTGLTAVGGGTYGSSSAVPVITVDSNGRITSISPVTVSGGGGGGAGSAGVTRNITTFTATAGQTSFNVSYTVGTIDVFLNGSRLTDAEFTATNGTSVVLATGASLNDVIDVAAYSSALGIEVKNNGTLVGTATTINFSTDLNATFSNGTATVVSTASGGGGGGVSEALAIAYAVAL